MRSSVILRAASGLRSQSRSNAISRSGLPLSAKDRTNVSASGEPNRCQFQVKRRNCEFSGSNVKFAKSSLGAAAPGGRGRRLKSVSWLVASASPRLCGMASANCRIASSSTGLVFSW